MVGKSALVALAAVLAAASMQVGFAQEAIQRVQSRELPASFLDSVQPMHGHPSDSFTRVGMDKPGVHGVTPAATVGIPGVDTVENWSDQFVFPGFDSAGNPQSVWPYTMVGTPPESGQSTTIQAPVIPVSVELLDANGHVAYRFRPSHDITRAVLTSPVFEPFAFTSGTCQYNDQMMRAEFWERINDGESNWHTNLEPHLKQMRHMQIPFLTASGTNAWQVVVSAAAGNPLLAMIDSDTFSNLLFPTTIPVTNGTPIGAAELAGDITTQDISTFLFNNTVLFIGNVSVCCIVGFHGADVEPGDASNGNNTRFFVLNYSSWTSPDVFRFGAEDITAFSHEVAETFNDPLVNNATPWWLNTDRRTGAAICQNNLEVGDVIEILSGNPVYAAALNGRTYHPQNVALFPWFAFQSPSSAHLGAYSFPDETTLLKLSPAPLLPGCKTPPPH
jgi:hypothetical protein